MPDQRAAAIKKAGRLFGLLTYLPCGVFQQPVLQTYRNLQFPDRVNRRAAFASKAPLQSLALLLLGLAACNSKGPATQVDSRPGETSTAISFAFGGDVAGQNVCRDQQIGFPVFEHILARQPDFFVGLGDMIYADTPCEALGLYGNTQIPRHSGIATDLESYLANWQYVRDDESLSRLLAEVPYFTVWDDHEVRNDFGPADDFAPDSPDLHLLPAARAAFEAFNPRHKDEPYFSKKFSPLLELFFLDTRSFRDPNSAVDKHSQPKTMLGGTQRTWLTEALADSEALWKVIISSVPLSIPTGWPPEKGRDGWANGDQDTGFELEMVGLLRDMADHKLSNLVFLSADVHFATGFRYQPFADQADFVFHEFVTGPLHAGLFPSHNLDETLKPQRLFFYGPESPESVTDFDTALRWFNFGHIRINTQGELQFSLIDATGRERERIFLKPVKP